jgi:thymidylate synthase (FAD)
MIEVNYINHMGSDLSVVNAARVSFGKKSDWEYDEGDVYSATRNLSRRDTKLIKYLAAHKHMSPFGHVFASFHVKAPLFVARQLVKHKFLRWNEISRRYVDDEPEFYQPLEWRGRSLDVKQGSAGKITVSSDIARDMADSAKKDYEYLLDLGICPEQARMVLPQSMMTEWYWSGSLDAFADMCSLRCSSDTQAETRQIASEISTEMCHLFPESWTALRANN